MRKAGESSSWSGRAVDKVIFLGEVSLFLGKKWVHLIKGTCFLGKTLPDIWPSESREGLIKARALWTHWQEKMGLVAVHTREMAITWINAFQFSVWKIKGQKLSLFVVVFSLLAISAPFNNHTTDVFRLTEYISSVTKCATLSALKIVLLLKWHTSSGNLQPPLQQKMHTTFLTEESKSKATHYP